jgi:nucleoside-diphosphate-sugar epimerase
MDKQINKILVMGASGFVGGRLVEKLIIEHGHIPKCLVRDYGKLTRIARFPVEIVYGDIIQPDGFEQSIKNCDVYIYSAHGKDKNKAISWEVDTNGLENMLKLAVKNRIKQFIFLSTTAIYESESSKGEFDESVVPVCSQRDYAGGKLEGEKICFEYSKKYNLPVTVLRPTIIFGPFAPSFTIYPAELIMSGALKDYGCFGGICNPVYIDDVVDVIIKCILNEKAFNEIFIVSSGDTLSWKEFFDAFSLAITGKRLETSGQANFRIKSMPLFLLKKILKLVVQIAPDFAKSVYGFIKSKGSGDWSWVKGQDASTINLNFYKKELIFKIDKLRTKLEYEPQYNFNKGFKITADWLKHHRYIKKFEKEHKITNEDPRWQF